MKRHRLPHGERAITPVIAGQFPGAIPFVPLPNNCQADFCTQTSIAEIEPVLRWQHGLGQILEYWTLALRSLHPILILVTDTGTAARRATRRAETTCDPLPLQLMIYDPAANAWRRGGPAAHYQTRPDWPLIAGNGAPWRAPEYLLRVYDEPRLPYCCWRRTYDDRQRLTTRAA